MAQQDSSFRNVGSSEGLEAALLSLPKADNNNIYQEIIDCVYCEETGIKKAKYA